MKLSQLRPCDACGGPLRARMRATWAVVRVSQAMFNPNAANRTLALAAYLGAGDISKPGALGIAEVMGPDADDAVMIFGDKDRQLMTELFLCFDCYCKPICLADLLERRREKEESA